MLQIFITIIFLISAVPIGYADFNVNSYKPYGEPASAIKRVELVTAQGIVESNLHPFVIGKDKEKGAFQVIERLHGKVPKDTFKQIKQNEEILDELLEEVNHDTFKATMRYNGSGQKAVRYAKKVRRLALEISMLGYC